jgi:hypothetical protein
MGSMSVDLPGVERALSADADIVFAYLFGSHATGTAGPTSDVDVDVYLRPGVDAFEARLRILGRLQQVLRSDAVDLVILNTAPLSLAGRILRQRQVLIDRAPFERHQYESLTSRMFIDFRVREHRLLSAMTAHG